MKVWISCDMEGVAGIVDWDQCLPPAAQATRSAAQLMLARGQRRHRGRAWPAGPTEIVVNDSHGTDGQPRPAPDRRRAALPVGPPQAAVHDAGARRELRRGLPRRLPRLDLRPPLDAVAHLQPRGVRGRPGQRRAGGGERHQRPGRRALRRPDRPRVRRPGHPRGDRAVRAGRRARGDEGVDHPVQRRSTCTRTSRAALIREGAEEAVRRVAAGTVRTPGDRPAGPRSSWTSRPATWPRSPPGPRGAERTGERTVRIEGDDLLRLFYRPSWPSPTSPGRPAAAEQGTARPRSPHPTTEQTIPHADLRSPAA